MPCSPNMKDWRVLIVVALLHSSPSSRLSASSRHYPILHNSSLPLYHSSHAGAVALAAALPLPIVTGLARHPVAVLVEADEVDELVAHAGYQVGYASSVLEPIFDMKPRLTWTVTFAGLATLLVGSAVQTGAVPD
jgi:hypothetical protein